MMVRELQSEGLCDGRPAGDQVRAYGCSKPSSHRSLKTSSKRSEFYRAFTVGIGSQQYFK